MHIYPIFAVHFLNDMARINYDALGITTSVACAVHCAVFPLLITAFPILGADLLHNGYFEYGMIGLAFIVGIYALYQGFRKCHHKAIPVVLFTAGISFLLLKELFQDYHTLFLIPATVTIISAHYLNYNLCRKAGYCKTGDAHQH